MTLSSSISRDSFQEPKNYLGVHFQQGRPILDADLNEAQAVLRSMVRRGVHDAAGDGSPNHGFAIEQILPPLRRPNPLDDPRRLLRSAGEYTSESLDYAMQYLFGRLAFFLTVPGDRLKEFTPAAFTASQGRARVSRDHPYQGDDCLRVSGHTGSVTVSQKLDSDLDLSAYDVLTFRYRLNRPVAGTIRFFLRDDKNNRTSWPCQTPLTFPADTWLAGAANLADGRFHIDDEPLPVLRVDQEFLARVYVHSGPTPLVTPLTSELSGENRPSWITNQSLAIDERSPYVTLGFTPDAVGTFSFGLTVTDGANRSATRSMSVTVRENDGVTTGSDLYHVFSQMWSNPIDVEQSPDGTTTDLTAIREFGFELYQADEPLVWDLDDLRLGGAGLQALRGGNDFVIRGSEIAKHVRRAALVSMMRDEDGGYPTGINVTSDLVFQAFNKLAVARLQKRLDSELVLAAQEADGPGRFHLAGLPCAQAEDILYSDQADPNDEPLGPPDVGQTRRDEVYLDAWTEPVTYVQDPAIREVALGGPDTSAREQVRHRVRVIQGGRTPTGDGMGAGTLSTEGAYTAAANRLYRVEIDRKGDIGVATFRWSHENASVIGRVIDDVAADSTGVVVEDASAFHPGDLVLLRTESHAERHEVSQVTGNEITLAGPVDGDFAAIDRPMLQRWDGFGVAITADPDDETVSVSVPLDDGVRVRFGGHSMCAGDFWTFTTRYLAGDERAGTDAATGIERLDFARPRGVRHRYAPLAAFTRQGEAPDGARITDIEDRRAMLGGSMRSFKLPRVTAALGFSTVHIGGIRLPVFSRGSGYLVTLSGVLKANDGMLFVNTSFYTDEMTDPQASTVTGRVLQRQVLYNYQGEDLAGPTTLNFFVSGQDFDSALSPPTTVQFFLVGFSSTMSVDADLTAAVQVTTDVLGRTEFRELETS